MEEPPRPGPHPAPAPDPDALLRRWRDSGDAAALGALFDATAPELFAVALHLCRDPALAEDALQETYLAALQHLDRFEADRRVVPWLAGILRNKVHEVRRFGARAPDPRRLAPPPDPEGPLAAAATAEEEARVRAALEDLEDPYREVAILRWRHGLEPAEIAAAKRMAPGTVRSLLHRAAERLKRDLVGLPALLLLRDGTAAPRGLAAVRAEVIRRAPLPVLPATAAGSASALLLGGALVAQKTAVAAAAILLLAGAGWLLLRGEGVPPASPPTRDAAAAPAPAHPAEAPPATGAAGTAVPAAPVPVEGPRITGRVLDREGRPVPGARVACYPDTLAKVLLPSDLGAPGAPGASAVAAADGRFEVAASPDAPFHTVLASASGFAEGFLTPVRAGAAVDLVLDRPCALAGRVTDMDGNPVPKARVRVLHLVDILRIEREALAGADGSYRVEGLLPHLAHQRLLLGGQALVEVTAAGFAPLLLERGIRGDTLPGTTGTLDAILARGSSVAGRVLDADTGEGIAGARVVLWSIEGMMSFQRADGGHVASPWGPRPLQEALSGEGGAFRFDGVPCAGAHPSASHSMGMDGTMTTALVGAWKDGFCGTSAEIPLVAEGKVTERELRLPPAASVRGRVVDGAGKPLAGIRVWTTREGAPRMGWFPPFYEGVPLSTGTTKEDGTYRIAGLPAERDAAAEFTVASQSGSWGDGGSGGSEGRIVVAAKAGEEVSAPDIVHGREETATAVVVATEESGAPVWGATVASVQEFSGAVLRTDSAGRAVYSVSLFRTGRTGEKVPRPPQETTLVVKSPGFGPATVAVTPAAADPPEVRVVLSAAHRLSGRVVEADGSPARGATVIVADGAAAVGDAFPEEGPRARPRTRTGAPALLFLGNATTDGEGRFTVQDLPAGPWHVQAYRYLKVYGGSAAGGFAAGPKALRTVTPGVPSGIEDLLLTLPADDSPPTGLVEGSVRDAATGRPVWNFQAWVVRGPESVAGGTPSGGKFLIEGVPEGTWTLRVTAPGYAEGVLPDLAVAAGAEPRRAEVALARGTTVVGRIRDAAGGSLADLKATFASAPRADGGISYAAGVVEKDGAFRVQGLTAGTWTLSVSGGGFGPNQRVFVPLEGGEVGIAEGTGEVRLEVVVAAGGILTVGVRDPRFPPNAMEGGRATEEQAALGAASRIEIRDGAGKVVREQAGVAQGYVGALGYVVLLPGDYEARLLAPGGEPRVERVRIEAGKRATVTFRGE